MRTEGSDSVLGMVDRVESICCEEASKKQAKSEIGCIAHTVKICAVICRSS